MPADAATPGAPEAPAPTETVVRPEPGTLARGVWEAPPWAFYATLASVLILALLYAAARAGLLRRRPRP
ncbi:MAG TPA: hypothetical protein VGI39_05535 [Polyangiaceae bacterium]|jgi:hypothetical protein